MYYCLWPYRICIYHNDLYFIWEINDISSSTGEWRNTNSHHVSITLISTHVYCLWECITFLLNVSLGAAVSQILSNCITRSAYAIPAITSVCICISHVWTNVIRYKIWVLVIIIIKSEMWMISHCLRVWHETMAGLVWSLCLYVHASVWCTRIGVERFCLWT